MTAKDDSDRVFRRQYNMNANTIAAHFWAAAMMNYKLFVLKVKDGK